MQDHEIKFKIAEPRGDESSTDPNPSNRVMQNAVAKVFSVSEEFPDSLIVGADTIVYLDGECLGKPESPEDAMNMLESLSGKTLSVFTGVALLDTSNGVLVSDYEVTQVMFHRLSHSAIVEYVESGEPLDKAGAYGIQGKGAALIAGYSGSWSNIVGLPMELLCEMLKKKGYAVKDC